MDAGLAAPELPTLDLDGSVDFYLARTAPRSRPAFLPLLLAIGLALALLPVVQVTVTVSAPGVLRPQTERHDVLAGVAGVVAAVPVRDGRAVTAGELLVALAPGALEARSRAAAAELDAAHVRAADLQALVTAGPEHASLRTGELVESALRASRERADRRLAAASAERALGRLRRLDARGLAAPAELEDATTRAAQARATVDALVASQTADWQAELARSSEQVRSALANVAAVQEERAGQLIRAPIGGTIEILTPLSPGSFVAAGQRIAVVSPAGPVIAEAYVSPSDVGLLEPGAPVRLLVDAFDHTRWGALAGRVSTIADDAAIVDGRAKFRIRCVLDHQRLRRPGGGVGILRKGMTFQARFPVGRRSLFSLLQGRLDRWIDRREGDALPRAADEQQPGT